MRLKVALGVFGIQGSFFNLKMISNKLLMKAENLTKINLFLPCRFWSPKYPPRLRLFPELKNSPTEITGKITGKS